MALMKCPKCGHNISDKAKQCPKCGHIIAHNTSVPQDNTQDNTPTSNKTVGAIIAVIGVAILFLLIFVFILPATNGDKSAVIDTDSAAYADTLYPTEENPDSIPTTDTAVYTSAAAEATRPDTNKVAEEVAAVPVQGYEEAKSETPKRSKSSNTSSNGPEWINGVWKLNTTVSTSLGPMKVNATLIINRANQMLVSTDCGATMASGTYHVYDNSIHCGSAYYDLDMSNHRISYGNGHYFHKVSN